MKLLNNNLFNKINLDHELLGERKKKVLQYLKKQDQERCLGASIMLAYIYKEFADKDMKNDSMKLGYNKYGKPYFQSPDNIFFNLSHSGNYVICGVDTEEIGVDVEERGEVYEEILYNCFTLNEIEVIMSHTGQKARELFYDIWTMKESYTKLIGKGLNCSLNRLEVLMHKEVKTINLSEGIVIPVQGIDKDYSFAISTRNEKGDIEVNMLNIDKIVDILHILR